LEKKHKEAASKNDKSSGEKEKELKELKESVNLKQEAVEKITKERNEFQSKLKAVEQQATELDSLKKKLTEETDQHKKSCSCNRERKEVYQH